jgi:transcription elongation factor Elf1
MTTSETKKISFILRWVLFGCFAAGIAVCIFFITQSTMTDRESAMLGILLTILSVLASWIITDMYGAAQYSETLREVKDEHRNNLRTYALKAAEKVNNLSNELNKLSLYLEQELNYTDYRTAEEELLAKEERIESAIHLVRTLKSVNDTGLSDWEGVIGEELDQRREEQEEKEEAFTALVERVESLIEDQRQDVEGSRNDATVVRQEVESLKKELQVATRQLGETTIPRHVRKKEPKQDVEAACPACGTHIAYQQRASLRSVKLIPCKACGARLVSRFTERGVFSLTPRSHEPVEVLCPHCEVQNSVPLDNVPGSSVMASCSSCQHSFRVLRTIDTASVAAVRTANASAPVGKIVINEEMLERVRREMPAQPWPTGTHHEIATKLELSTAELRRAVNELIKRGKFLQQIDGVLYTPVQTGMPAAPDLGTPRGNGRIPSS